MTITTNKKIEDIDTQNQKQRMKYELSLAEFPLAFLSTRVPEEASSLVYEDEIIGKNGVKIQRRWEIMPHKTLGFPTPSTQSTMFELFQLWSEQGFASKDIHFGTIYELIKRKGLKQDDKKTYQRIKDDLDCLSGIVIRAKNAFWDNERKTYISRTFSLFQSLDFAYSDPKNPDKSALPFGVITASETLWQSVLANSIFVLKDMDRLTFHNYTPIEQRLGLYLAKMLYNKSQYRRHADKLTEQIPITARLYKQRKYRLSKACDGLIKKKFPYMSGYKYQRAKNGKGDIIIFYRKTKNTIEKTTKLEPGSDEEARLNLLVSDIIHVTEDEHSRNFYTLVVKKVREQTIYRAISTTRQAHLQSEIKTSKARYFTALIQRLAKEDGVSL
jgi:hypothetical protein